MQNSDTPKNAGKRWTIQEDYFLLIKVAFDRPTVSELAVYFARSEKAICGRLYNTTLKRSGTYGEDVREYLRRVDNDVFNYDFEEYSRSSRAARKISKNVK